MWAWEIREYEMAAWYPATLTYTKNADLYTSNVHVLFLQNHEMLSKNDLTS